MKQIPLRTADECFAFCDTYFQAVGAKARQHSDMYQEYVLPLDIDKELTDRPFYWMWVEKTNQTVEPTTLRLAFTDAAKMREDERMMREHQLELENHPPQSPYERMFKRAPQAELVNLGSFRLNKICESAMTRGQFACVKPAHASPLTKTIPWLMLNGMIQYVTDSMQEEWFSVGVCLLNRQTLWNFYDHVQHIEMNSCNPKPLLDQASISPADATRIAKQAVEHRLQLREHTWAQDAQTKLVDDLAQLDTYYTSILPDHPSEEQALIRAEHARKRDELIAKSNPHINIEWTQMALVGLSLRNHQVSD